VIETEGGMRKESSSSAHESFELLSRDETVHTNSGTPTVDTAQSLGVLPLMSCTFHDALATYQLSRVAIRIVCLNLTETMQSFIHFGRVTRAASI